MSPHSSSLRRTNHQSQSSSFSFFFREEGMWGLTKGWAPTLIGYSLQGLGKFGFYEVFKNLYGGALGEENAYLYRTTLYLLASASAEFFADIALAPWEATKVRIQTQDNWASSLRQGLPKLYGKIKQCVTCPVILELLRLFFRGGRNLGVRNCDPWVLCDSSK